MKTKILVTMALMAGLMLAGCSKEESNMEEETKGQTGQQDYFEEPILDFSLTLEQLKAKETHKLLSDKAWTPGENDPKDAAKPWQTQYSYPNKDGEIITTYYWTDKDKGDMYAVVMDWSGDKGVSNDLIRQQMIKRYGYPTPDSDNKEVYISNSRNLRIVESATSIVFYHLLPPRDN